MSNAFLPTDSNPEKISSSELSLVNNGNPHLEQQDYPVYEFDIPGSKMTDGPVLPVGTSDRVRGTLTALIESDAPVDSRIASPNFRKRRLNAASTFMKKKFASRGMEYSYRDILDVKTTENSLLFALMADHDPVAQVLSKVAAEYGDAIGEREFGNVVHGVLITTHWPVLEEYYRQRINEFRSQLA